MKFFITTASGFEKEAKKELKEIVDCTVKHLFMRGILFLETDSDFLSIIRDADTTFISHVHPVQKQIELTKIKEMLDKIVESVLELNDISENETFAVRCIRRGIHDFTSRDVEIAVGNKIDAKVDLDSPQNIVIIQIIQSICFIGVIKSEELIAKKIKVERKYEQRPLNRAEFKLREAIEEFRIKLKPEWRGLDVGASPGGWTKVLAEKIKEVVAVDPGDLEIDLPNIKHIKKRIENVGDIGMFDIVVNDMNLDPIESSHIMCHLSQYLKDKGIAVMTVKFVTKHRNKHIDDAKEILSKCYGVERIYKVAHNKHETTLFLVKK